MKYSSGRAFRQALEAHLRVLSQRRGIPLLRLRKMVAFDRLLVRLIADQPEGWLLKGGLALQFRLGDRARTTMDVDLHSALGMQEARASLQRAALRDLGDWFQFEVGQPRAATALPEGGLRFPMRALLDGRTFEAFHLDLGLGDPVLEEPEWVAGPSLLEFAGIAPTSFPCYPLSQQIAEKLHALTRPYAGGEGSRVRDLVDLLLIAEMAYLEAVSLWTAIHATFRARETHAIPHVLPQPPSDWQRPYRRLAEEVGLQWLDLSEASEALQDFLHPILAQNATGVWDASAWRWISV
ncbi:MAG: nucleotidyl transferase AbiEii/AbiGii toxin family protein [Deltaproteobacteria bacterium]|nr:nucleotidyl transferase AbiEii/AbiGii toxin family protein [Deltaproteobacteria bacterium]